MPSEIGKDMFKVIGRVLPSPNLEFEDKLLEPLTSVFADYQAAYATHLDTNAHMKELPDCRKFAYELVSTNMLLEDVYAPPGRI